MDSEEQLLSEDTAQNSGYYGVEAPDLIQQDITSDVKGSGQDHVQLKDKHNVLSSGEVSFTEGEKAKDDEIEVKAGPQKKKIEKEDGNGKTTDNDYRGNSINTKRSIVLESGNDMNVLVDSDICMKKDSDQKDYSENNKIVSEEAINDKEKSCITKLDKSANENKKSNEKPDSDVVQDDGNNNVKNADVGQSNDSVRKTRFSSEIMIHPKAYFQTGTETVVMMPPSCLSEDLFENDSRNSADFFSSSTHVVVNAKPSDSVLPQTFLPLTLFTCLFCPMIGLFAVYKSYSVKASIKKGDTRKANEASQHARQLGVLTLCIGFLFVLAIVMIAVLVSTLT